MNDKEVKAVFEAAIVQMATSAATVGAIAKTFVTEEAIIGPVARVLVCQAQKEVSVAAQRSFVTAPPLLSQTPDGSSSSEDDWMERKSMQYMWRKPKKKTSSFCSEDREACSRRRSIRTQHESTSSSGENIMSPSKLNVIHPDSVTFSNNVRYRTYRLHNRTQKYDGKMATRTAKLAKWT